MTLLNLYNSSSDQLRDKQTDQIIAIAGDGKLKDDGPASAEFREYLSAISSERLIAHAEECLSKKFEASGLALQDIVNELGCRLGYSVTHGRYRGSQNQIGFDGLWTAPNNNYSIVVEVKTTDAYRIDLDVIAGYRKKLIRSGDVDPDHSSMLIIVGRQDTGDLEAQIRGSKHAWSARILSVESLGLLIRVKEDVENPETTSQIQTLLIPHDYTRLDEIINLVFKTTSEAQDEVEPEDGAEKRGKKFTPVNFHQACIDRIQTKLKLNLVKRSAATFSSPDGSTTVLCIVSRGHSSGARLRYWFAFHPHQQDQLKSSREAYVAFGCGSPDKLVVIPFGEFEPMLQKFNQTTTKEGRSYWHVHIEDRDSKLTIPFKNSEEASDVTSNLIAGK